MIDPTAPGELDIHLIHEGRHEELWHVLGAQVREHPERGTSCRVWAANALAGQVVGEEADVDVGVGDGDADLVLNGGDRLGMDCEPAERADLGGGTAGLGWGLV